MNFEILNLLYSAVVVLDKDSGEVIHSHGIKPFENLKVSSVEELNAFFSTHFDDGILPLFDKISVNEKTYWISRKCKDAYIYYFIQECGYWDGILDKAQKDSRIDGLTSFFNKSEIDLQITNFLLTYLRYKKNAFSLIMIDIDFFKKVNDDYGHLSGDYVLQELSELIRDIVRDCDICGRFGGEEFIIILPETKVAGALKLANRLRESCEKEKYIFNGNKIDLTISLGVTSVSITDSLLSLIDRCDSALYDAKKNGRNRVEYR